MPKEPEAEPAISLGDIVHYRLSAEFGKSMGGCRPMIITKLGKGKLVSGQVLTDPSDYTVAPVVPRTGVLYGDDAGTWHYRADCAGP